MALPSQYKKSYRFGLKAKIVYYFSPYASVYNPGNETEMLLVLAPEFVALYTANFCSHLYVRAEPEIWPTESYFSGTSNSSNQ